MLCPREQELDAPLIDEPTIAQEGEDLVTEQQLGRAGVDERHRDPVVLVIASAGRRNRMDVWIELNRRSELNVWTTATKPGRTRRSSATAADISSLT